MSNNKCKSLPELPDLYSMYTKSWLIIRDDAKKTFEVIGQDSNTNHFTNSIHAMQRSGMSVSGMTPPVTGQAASKEAIKISGYTWEEGLHRRLLKQQREIDSREFGGWEE